MGIVRNNIDITGISPESELPFDEDSQRIKYSEVENIYIPNHKPRIRNLMQISIKIDIISKRIIKTPKEKIIVFDGIKKINLIYMDNEDTSKANILNIEVPYNTFVEISNENESDVEAKVYIVDAYFHVLDGKRIYSNILYLVDFK